MDIYNEIFHEPLLNLSKEFYSHWAAQKQNELSCSNYINEVSERSNCFVLVVWFFKRIMT